MDSTNRSRLGQIGSFGSKLHDPVPDRIDQRRQRHRRTRMSGIRLLDGIDRERADRVDRQLIEIVVRSCRFDSLIDALTGYVRRLLDMPAELVAHRREQLVGEIRFAARAEPLVQRRGQHMGRHALIDRGLDGPAAFAGIGHPAREMRRGPGSCIKAAAERSSSQDATTLPRRQTSAMSGRFRSYW